MSTVLRRADRRNAIRVGGALAVAAAIVVVSVVWGWRVQADQNVKLGAAPLVGKWQGRFGWSLVVAVLLAAAVVTSGQRLATRLRFGRMVATTAIASTAFTFLLAASDGLDRLLDPVVHPTEYWANLATLPPTGDMLERYGTVKFLRDYSVHAKGHPPGFFVVLKALAAVGLGKPWVTGALSYLGVVVVVVAVLMTVRTIAGPEQSRAVAPFLVVAPYAVWMGTSADAFYAAVTAVGVLLLACALRCDHVRSALAFSVASGFVLAAGLFFTYGTAIFLILPIVVLVGLGWKRWRRLAQVAMGAVVGASVVTAVYAAAGFWWFDGATTTKKFYWAGTAQFRPANYFAVGNLGAALIAVGPAVVVGLALLRDRRLWLTAGGALTCVLVADASQYSKAEVERIWLIFYPWLTTATAAVLRPRVLLALQATAAVGLQTFLVSKW